MNFFVLVAFYPNRDKIVLIRMLLNQQKPWWKGCFLWVINDNDKRKGETYLGRGWEEEKVGVKNTHKQKERERERERGCNGFESAISIQSNAHYFYLLTYLLLCLNFNVWLAPFISSLVIWVVASFDDGSALKTWVLGYHLK